MTPTPRRRALLASVSALAGLSTALAGLPAQAIIINNNLSQNQRPTVDTAAGVNGVGQMLIPSYNATGTSVGFGVCTGTLINPRTVIFAAHCVNGRPASAYGNNSGGQAIAFGFRPENNAGTPGNTPLINYAFGAPTGGGARGPRNRTNVGDDLYNANQVFYDPRSLLEPQGDFLEADIALATLDTPAKGVPTWTLLFSPLTAPTHVTITGYGLSGQGTNGATQGIDFRRRAAENILQSLVSLDNEDRALFGPDPSNENVLPQDLYFIDFDDPARGTAQRNRFDFDVHRDAALPREGTTAGGDSGGPLIVDQRFSQPVIAGVLSGGGGYSAQQPRNSYGERSFYQPLFLFWDVIVANNPYRYVSANTGDGDWFDPTRWTQQMDPAYAVIENGQLVNGLPTTPARGVSGDTPGFGNVCNGPRCTNFSPPPPPTPGGGSAPVADPAEVSPLGGVEALGGVESLNVTSGGPYLTAPITLDTAPPEDAAGAPVADPAEVSLAQGPAEIDDTTVRAHDTEVSPTADPAERAPAPPPASTPGIRIAGGPGSTNFTPNNQDGNRLTGARANYYDVTLSNAGTTTLGANADPTRRSATVDRLTIANSGARLNITAGGALNVLMDANLMAGGLNVDGRLATPEFFLMAGLLSGSGTIETDFLTSVMGTIAPGGVGTVGTLTVANGNAILGSGNQLLIDVGASGSDLLAVTCQRAASGACVSGQGVANVGGLVGFNVLAGAAPAFGSRFTFLTAAGGVTGRFSAVSDNITGVLRVEELIYNANSVEARIGAASFLTLTDPNAPLQAAFGSQLDAARANPGALAALRPVFNSLDVLEGAPLRASLESLAPFATVTTSNLARAQLESFTGLLGQRAGAARSGGGLTVMGSPLAALQSDPSAMPGGQPPMASDAPQPMGMRMAEGYTAFIAGGFLNGESQPLTNTVFGGEEDLNSSYAAAGLERTLGGGFTLGAAVAYSNGDGDYGQLSQVELDQVQLGLHAAMRFSDGGFVNAHGTVGTFDGDTVRRPFAGATALEALGQVEGFTSSAQLEAGYDLVQGALTFTPVASVTYNNVSLDETTETGTVGLSIGQYDFEQVVARAGIKAGGDFRRGGVRITPHARVGLAADVLNPDDDSFRAGFVVTPQLRSEFDLTDRDRFWYEVGAGVSVQGERVGLHLNVAADLARDDLETQTFSAAVSYRF